MLKEVRQALPRPRSATRQTTVIKEAPQLFTEPASIGGAPHKKQKPRLFLAGDWTAPAAGHHGSASAALPLP